MHHIVILDPGLKSPQSNGTIYSPLKDGLNYDIFIKNSAGQPLEGKVYIFYMFKRFLILNDIVNLCSLIIQFNKYIILNK